MEKIKLWWLARSARDRRALTLLLVAVPAIFFWYFVTRPLADRLKLAHRILETSRAQALDLQEKLNEFASLQAQALSLETTAASGEVMTSLETAFRSLSAEVASPTLNRTALTIFGKRQPAAQVNFERFSPAHAWKVLQSVASSGVSLADLEITSDPQKNQISLQLKAWQ